MSDPLRFFVPTDSLLKDQVVICGEPFHHICHVLRSKVGTELLLLDGAGLCCQVRLEEIGKQQAQAIVLDRTRQLERTLPITLLQALPKGDKLDLVLQKGTELGAHAFQLVQTEHAVANLKLERLAKRMQRWQKIIREAARQSRRTMLPSLQPPQTLEQALSQPGEELKLVLWEAGSQPLATALPQERPSAIKLLIGPEGGFSNREMEQITACGFQPVHLGPRILRTETAGLAATPVLQYLYGDWQQAPASE